MCRVIAARVPLRTILLATVALLVAAAAPARAQGYISPYIGSNFNGDAACPAATPTCEKNTTVGISFGHINTFLGFEEDLSYAKGLFKDGRTENSSVLALMSNVVIGPRISYVRPYVGGGFGLLRTQTTFKPTSLVDLSNTDIGWNIGGGIMVAYSHIGIRGDIRTFHGFSDLSVVGFPVSSLKLDFSRAVVGLVIQ